MEAVVARPSSQARPLKKRRRSTTAAQIDVLLPAVGIETAAAGSASRPARKRRSTAQIDVLLLLPDVGIEAAAGPASRPARKRRRRTAQIGIPFRRAKTVRPHPVSSTPPDPNWVVRVVRRARSSPQDLDDDSNKRGRSKTVRPQSSPPPDPNWVVRRARSSLRDLDDSNKRARNRRDWSDLGDGPAGLIAERVLAYDVADYVRFRAVCRPWRQCYPDPRVQSGLDRRFHPWRWTMLREKLAAPHRRCFLNRSTGQCVQVDIPELHDHELLAVTPEGLLVLVHDRKHMCLLNPLTRCLMQLPPVTTLLPPEDHDSLSEHNSQFSMDFIAWGSGIANDDSTFVLCFSRLGMIGMAKPGDDRWTFLKYHCGTAAATLMFAGRLYCVTHEGLMVLQTGADQPPRLELAAEMDLHVSSITDSVHLVNNCGDLMLVHSRCRRLASQNNLVRCCDAYRVDLDTGTLLPVKSLGGACTGTAVFIGTYCSLSVSLDVFPSGSISPDTIYLSSSSSVEARAYHLVDGSSEDARRYKGSMLPRPHTLVHCLSLSVTR